ncbi:hypothetical protein AGMMS49992_21800 [Clostridia bacterium]|nr:hypothetical protein AGMMS49992_21800 [Clostridia bacterium]
MMGLHNWCGTTLKKKTRINPSLSLDLLSERFGYSTAYWSRYFSDSLGVAFSDFVWNRRLALFKERLIHSDAQIKDLVIEVGYLGVSSFTNRFRECEGVTPGQYRKLHSQKFGNSN